MKIRKATFADFSEVQRIARVLKVPGRPWCDWHTKRMILPVPFWRDATSSPKKKDGPWE